MKTAKLETETRAVPRFESPVKKDPKELKPLKDLYDLCLEMNKAPFVFLEKDFAAYTPLSTHEAKNKTSTIYKFKDNSTY